MTRWEQLQVVAGFAQWRLTWNRRNTRRRRGPKDNPKFMSARDAVRLIPDGAVLADAGLGASMHASVLYWALQEMHAETGHPSGLTLIAVGGHGGRGRIPGTLEEVGRAGLITRFITGHAETFKAMLRLAEAGRLEIQIIPQGTLCLLLAAQAEGRDSVSHHTGEGSFVDPRTGRGTPLVPADAEQLVRFENGELRYTCPPVQAAMFNVPAADRHGNLYVKHASMIAEAGEIARAARRNGGVVIANVGKLVEEGYDEVFLPAGEVNAIVLDPRTRQCAHARHVKPWRALTTDSDVPAEAGIERIRFINKLVGVTPARSDADMALARLGAQIVAAHAPRGATVNIGVGHPEEVSRTLYEHGLLDELTMLTESGAFGGIASPGIFFGTAVAPREIVPSAEAFRRMYAGLDVAVLGLLQADGAGNVNVSKRGEGVMDYVGPGGFIDITACAKLIVFCGSWMAGGALHAEDGQIKIARPGKPKFVEAVDEITFNGAAALARGKRVFYVTHAGVFELRPEGMTLIQVMPGIDVQRDILEFSPMPVAMAASGVPEIVDASVVTGKGFALALGAGAKEAASSV